MPTRKIFAVTQRKNAIVAIETTIEMAIWNAGGSETSVRTYIVIGPNTGDMEKLVESVESGLVIRTSRMNHGRNITIVIGAINCCASRSELHAAPPMA